MSVSGSMGVGCRFKAILVVKLFVGWCMVGLLGSMLVSVRVINRLFRSTDWCI